VTASGTTVVSRHALCNPDQKETRDADFALAAGYSHSNHHPLGALCAVAKPSYEITEAAAVLAAASAFELTRTGPEARAQASLPTPRCRGMPFGPRTQLHDPGFSNVALPGDNRTQQGCQTRLFFRFPAATSAHRYAPKSNLFSAVHPIQRRAPWRKSKSI
jgi:hypothetical protein